jgi:hypothetical protein
MKKELIILLFLIVLFTSACQEEVEKDSSEHMEDFKREACFAAHNADTCFRLDTPGITTREECCTKWKKCCE